MSTIRAICPHCVSPVDLEPAEVLLLTGPEATVPGTYLFYCATCENVAVKPACPAEISLLTSAGVRAGPPSGKPVAPSSSRPDARPFTLDDLLDFHLLLATDDRLAGLVAAADRPAA